jgi:hypothetical protein
MNATPSPRRSSPWRAFGIFVALVAVGAGLIWVLEQIPTESTSDSASTYATATATALPHLVYQSDWSHGADGWTLPAGAKIADGKLSVKTVTPLLIPIPYAIPSRNYSVEMDYLLVGNNKGGRFGFSAQDASGKVQYQLEFQCTTETVLPGPGDYYSNGKCPGDVLEGSAGGGYFAADYQIGPGAKTFRVEVHNNSVFMCVLISDCLEPITGNTPLASSPHIFIDVRGYTMVISQVRVYLY